MATDEQRAYSRGYAAATKRVKALEAEIERLKSRPPTPSGKSATIEYLVDTGEALIRVARLLIEAELPKSDPPPDFHASQTRPPQAG